MDKHSVHLAAGRTITVWREIPKTTEKKKSTKPPNHDIDMCCVTWAWKSDEELADELMKRVGVVRAVVEFGGRVTERKK